MDELSYLAGVFDEIKKLLIDKYNLKLEEVI
jgi:hypothetical protein